MAATWQGTAGGVRWRGVALVVAALAGAAVLAEWAGGLAQSAADEGKPAALPADLQAIPTDAVVFASVRPADLWEQEPARQLRQQLQKQAPQALDEWRKLVGLPPGDIERVTFVFLSFPPPEMPLIFVETGRPLDREKVLANVGPGTREEKSAVHTLHVGPRNNAIHFLGDRAYVAGSVEEVRQLLEHPAPKKPGPLAAALPLAAGKHSLVVGLNPAQVVDRIPENEIPPMGEPYKPLLKTQLATLTADIGKDVRGELHLSFADDKDAKNGKDAVQAGLSLARLGLGLAAQQVQKEPGSAKLAELVGRVQADLEDARVKQEGARVEVTAHARADLAAVGTLLSQAVGRAHGSAERAQSTNNLKQIALAMHNYHDTYKHFPAQALYSPDGKPLLSWRILILPFIEGDDLYKQFHLDEPWDSEHNKKLLAKMPRTYALPSPDGKVGTDTHYLGFAGPGAFFDGKKGLSIASFTDGTSNTLLVVEAAKGVPWTKPEDLPFDPKKPLPKMAAFWGANGFNAAFCDGSVHFLPQHLKPENLKALITRNGGEVLPADYDK